MNAAQAVAGILVVTSAVASFLQAQPEAVIGPIGKLVIGCISVGTTALALYLKVSLPGRESSS